MHALRRERGAASASRTRLQSGQLPRNLRAVRALQVGLRLATTRRMSGTNTKLTAATGTYFADLGRLHELGRATGERSG